MNAAKLFRRWKDQQTRLLRKLTRLVRACQRRGQAEEIHELRVVARRVRLLTRLGAAWCGKEVSHAYRDWARQLSATTDAIRDLDVALEWLRAQESSAATMAALTARRNRFWRRRRLRLCALPASHLRALSDARGGSKREERLGRRCVRLLRRLRQRVHQDAPRFFHIHLAGQHDFRRLVRRWRYLRELELPDRLHTRDRQLRQLLRLQEALGDRQNLLLADAALASLSGQSPETVTLRRQITSGLRCCEKEIRRQLRPFTGCV